MISKALIAASTKPIILAILLGGENYGYQIIQSAKEISGGELEWSDGMLYPVLHRLEKEGLIRSQWKLSENGRMRKYYVITELGRDELEKEKTQWMSVHKALSRLWTPVSALD
ncbi:PadR family transcriptional regulator [Acidobacteriota bacterium]